MPLLPEAKKLLIPAGSNDPRIKARAGVLHVDAMNSPSLYNFFKNMSGGIESHFYVKYKGGIEQYRDTDYEADANHKANPFALSVETQGFAAGKWSGPQLDGIKTIMLWANQPDVHGIPIQQIPKWDGSGWGYHTLFGSPGPWTPHVKSCPGPERKEQFHDILVPWMKELEDDLFTEKDRDQLAKLTAEVGDLKKAVENLKKREFSRYKKIRDLIESLRVVR